MGICATQLFLPCLNHNHKGPNEINRVSSSNVRANLAKIFLFKVIDVIDGPSGVFVINFEHISHLFQVLMLLTLKKQMLAGKTFRSLVRRRVKAENPLERENPLEIHICC